ncbi:hypothetical protein [Streptomyces sp. NPDC051098]|uniref:hypothetical protein n=1 Tax=Streptomyces sp. NPDC051098 TaxID=3155411 RepID=UPI00344536C4
MARFRISPPWAPERASWRTNSPTRTRVLAAVRQDDAAYAVILRSVAGLVRKRR